MTPVGTLVFLLGVNAGAAPVPAAALQTRVPECAGSRPLDHAVDFDWPQKARREREFASAQWAYFTCEGPYRTVADAFRRIATLPPFILGETNWIERPEGALGIYYDYVRNVWCYVWFVPDPERRGRTLLAVTQSARKVRHCEAGPASLRHEWREA